MTWKNAQEEGIKTLSRAISCRSEPQRRVDEGGYEILVRMVEVEKISDDTANTPRCR